MRSYTSKETARREASMAATRTLIRLGIDLSQPIDIFKIIQDEGIWLMFQPMRDLFGVYLRQDNTAGIILNSNHPLSLQRFTAAHEFGHHILQHGNRLDDEVYIERAQVNTNLYEVAADAFAAHFLMPLQLVNTMLVRMELPRDPGQLTAVQVYQLALDMGVSYSAAVNHLATLNKITREAANELRKEPPKRIKARIGGGPLENSWADIWVLDKGNTGKRLRLRVYDELRICLPETPSTGYVWTLADGGVLDMTNGEPKYELPGISKTQGLLQGDHSGNETSSSFSPLALVSNEYEANTNSGEHVRYGGSGNRYLTFRTLMPGRYTLRLLKRRPWQMTAPPTETFEVSLDVFPKPTGESNSGLSEMQQPLMAGE